MSEVTIDSFLVPVKSLKLSVSSGNSHSVKKKCKMVGAFLSIHDPEKLSPPIELFLPHWKSEIKTSGKHKTIVLISLKVNTFPVFKLKSRSFETIDSLGAAIDALCHSYNDFISSDHKQIVKVMVNGEYANTRFIMTNDMITVLHKKKPLFDLSRAKKIVAYQSHDDPHKVIFEVNNMISQTVKCKSTEDAHKLVLQFNSKPKPIEIVAQVTIDDATIPSIDVTFFDTITAPKQAKKVSEFELEETDSIRVNQTRNRSSTVPRSVSSPDPLNEFTFEEKMKHRASKIRNTLQSSKSVTSITPFEVLQQSVTTGREAYPLIVINPPDLDLPMFILPKTTETNMFYETDPREKFYEEINYSDCFNVEAALQKLCIDPDVKALHIDIKNPPDTKIEEIKKKIKLSQSVEKPKIATGLFLQGRKVQISTLYQKLSKIRFSIIELDIIIQSNPFHDEETCFYMINALCSKNLCSSFFRILEYLGLFKTECYWIDALIRIPQFCSKIAKSLQGTIEGIPYTDIPLADATITSIRVQESFHKWKESIESSLIEEFTPSHFPLAEIIYSVILTIKQSRNLKVVDIWSMIKKADHTELSIQALTKCKSQTSSLDKVITFLLILLTQKGLAFWLLKSIKNTRTLTYNISNRILVCEQLYRIEQFLTPEFWKGISNLSQSIAQQIYRSHQ